MDTTISVVVLAGGRSSRMGVDKAFLQLGEQTVLEHVLDHAQALSDDVVLVARDQERYRNSRVRLVLDEPGHSGTLIGLYSGLRAARLDVALAVGCDMPFLNEQLVRFMGLLSQGQDVVIPRVRGHLEPLHAVYRKTCLEAMEVLLRKGIRKVLDFLPNVRVRYLEQQQVELFDPLHRAFTNLNTPADWQKVQQIYTCEDNCRSWTGHAGWTVAE